MKIKKVKNYIINIYKESILMWCFIFTCLVNSCLLRILTVGNILDLRPLLMDLVFLITISIFSFLIKKEKRFKYFIIWSFVLTAICVINSLYYTYYSSFSSVSLLATSIFVVDVGDAIVENVIEIKDFVYIWQIILMFIIYNKKMKKKYLFDIEDKKKLIKTYALLALSIFMCTSIFIPLKKWSKLTHKWNREAIVMTFGIYNYQFVDLIQSLEPNITNLLGHDNALKFVTDYYEENGYKKNVNEYTDIFKGKNIIAIHAESIQKNAMDLSFNGEEVTPNLNKLASEGIFFSNFYSQVGVGTSSDTEFTLSTSLMPSYSGTVFVNYFDRKYVSLQQLLKKENYYVYSMHANIGDFWNRATMHKNLGYDKFYDKEYYTIDETIGLGLSDKSFFKQSIPIMENIKNKNTPFYTTMIMLSNHTPFSDLNLTDEYPTTWTINIEEEEIVRNYINETVLGNYFRSVHYADQAIGEFIDELDESGLLDNTVVVIYGDHDARIDIEEYNLLYNYNPYTDTIRTEEDDDYVDVNEYTYELNRSVPLIIWTKDTKYNTEVKTPMGMIDVLPTLGNMLGIHSEYQLGHDIFSIKNNDNTVVLSNGSYITDRIYYNAQKGEIYSINGKAIDEKYVEERSKYASDLIEVSNYIINYDLIKEITEKDN